MAKFACSQAPVFIQGEAGIGKELIARKIHLQGPRSHAPFVAVDCSAIASEDMESQLFGQVKANVIGANSNNEGFIKAAHGGTLFLDEITDLPLATQVKLLHVIQEKTVRAIGASTEEAIDVRFISAAQKELETTVRQGTFRQDLYYRINVIGVIVPPLSERPEDITELTDYIIKKYAGDDGGDISIDEDALQALENYPFPESEKELEDILERATAVCDNEHITLFDLKFPKTRSTSTEPKTGLDAITLRQSRYKIEKLKLKLSKNK